MPEIKVVLHVFLCYIYLLLLYSCFWQLILCTKFVMPIDAPSINFVCDRNVFL